MYQENTTGAASSMAPFDVPADEDKAGHTRKSRVSRGQKIMQGILILLMAAPVRLNLDVGAINTITILDFFIWLVIGYYLAQALLGNLYLGDKLLFGLLAFPLAASLISLLWTQDVLSTLKNTFYLLTAIAAYLVSVNLFRTSPAERIANSIGAFIILSMVYALLYWSRIPIVWTILRFPVNALSATDTYELAARFARLDHPYLGRSNDYATTLAIFGILLVGIGLISRHRKYLVFAAVSATGILMTLSRGVVLSVGLVLAPALYLRRPSRKVIFITLLLLIGLIPVTMFVVAITNSGIDILGSRFNDIGNITNRFERYEVAWKTIAQAPFLGFGGGRYLAIPVNDNASAFHNTFLEQWASYGLYLGTAVGLSFLTISVRFFSWPSRHKAVRKVAAYAGLATIAYFVICTNQTSNEAVMPRLLFYLFLGFAVAFLVSLDREMGYHASGNRPL